MTLPASVSRIPVPSALRSHGAFRLAVLLTAGVGAVLIVSALGFWPVATVLLAETLRHPILRVL